MIEDWPDYTVLRGVALARLAMKEMHQSESEPPLPGDSYLGNPFRRPADWVGKDKYDSIWAFETYMRASATYQRQRDKLNLPVHECRLDHISFEGREPAYFPNVSEEDLKLMQAFYLWRMVCKAEVARLRAKGPRKRRR